VTFQVIPAIDVSDGQLARATLEGVEAVEAFGGDPVKAAMAFAEAGASWLHVVDLDLALGRQPANLEVLRAIVSLGVPVQASGGVATAEQVDALLSAGAGRVVLGSAALADREMTERLVHERADVLVVAIEAEGPAITPRGGDGAALPLWETLVWLSGLDVRRFLFVEVGRSGSLEGPDLDGVWALATHVRRPVIASGGIRHLDDLKAVSGLGRHVEGAVIGRALYEGGLDLRGAIAATA
jgi:phosphoribosylanthranilate isomerase